MIIVTQGMQNVLESLSEIFQLLMNFGLLLVNVLIKDENTLMWSLHYYKPYAQNCYSFEIIKIETFSPDNFTNELNTSFDDMFTSRQIEFQNCSLIVSVAAVDPFTIVQKASDGSFTYNGIDVRIVNEISEALNLNPIYVQAPDGKGRGSIYKNGTATGAQKMVEDLQKVVDTYIVE